MRAGRGHTLVARVHQPRQDPGHACGGPSHEGWGKDVHSGHRGVAKACSGPRAPVTQGPA